MSAENENESLNELHLFAGVGGGILGGMLLGHRCVCAVEINEYRRKVLLQRQRDSILPKFPIWDDVRTFDGTPWQGRVDIVCSGFPCQMHSDIGKMHGSDGFNGWPDTLRIFRESGAEWLLLENVTAILRGYFWTILSDLASVGCGIKWGVLSACSVGLPHTRERLFCLAHASRIGQQAKKHGLAECQKVRQPFVSAATDSATRLSRLPEPTIPKRPDGLADYMESIDAPGDGQVPIVVKLAWEILSQ